MFCHAVTHAHTVHFAGHPQKKGLSPDLLLRKIKYVKGVSCVSPCLFAPLVHSVPSVITRQSVGSRLQKFWHIWQEMGASPRVVSVLKDGYALLFKLGPPLTRSPLIRSGYANLADIRTAIADIVGNDKLNISKDENLTRLLDSFHRDKPKGRRGVPTWNLSLVLHQLTKAPFEPMRKASLKCLTFKTVFLLGLGSGKRRSEIHAWLYKNIRHQENWSQVSLYPSPIFLSKNQLALEGPACVAPVVIPALGPSLDKSLTEDKSLCPVRALRYYLDRTKDLRKDKDLVCVSSRRILSLPLSLPGSNKQCYYVTNCRMKKPKICIESELMMSRLLQLLRHFKEEFP